MSWSRLWAVSNPNKAGRNIINLNLYCRLSGLTRKPLTVGANSKYYNIN